MREIRWYKENGFRLRNGLPETLHKIIYLDELIQSEWSTEFEILMRNRLLMGAFRYGKFNNPIKGNYDCIDSIKRRLVKFQETGNKEYLVDIANLCMIEFIYTKHPNAHFDSIDDGKHVKCIK